MSNIVTVDKQMEQEFAYVDSIINAHTNSAIAKVNAEALQTYWEVGQFVSERLHSSRWGEHTVDELAAYLRRVNPKRRGYGKRSLYNMVKIYDTYSPSVFADTIEQLQLDKFVQSQKYFIFAPPCGNKAPK